MLVRACDRERVRVFVCASVCARANMCARPSVNARASVFLLSIYESYLVFPFIFSSISELGDLFVNQNLKKEKDGK